LTGKVEGQTDLGFGVRSGSLVGLRIQDYKSLCAAVNIHGTHTDTQTQTVILASLYN